MGNLFGRSSWSEEKEEFKRQMEEMIDKVNKLEEAQMRTADVVERPFGTGLDSLLSNVSKMWNDLGERLAALDKREGEARKEQELQQIRAYEQQAIRRRSDGRDRWIENILNSESIRVGISCIKFCSNGSWHNTVVKLVEENGAFEVGKRGESEL